MTTELLGCRNAYWLYVRTGPTASKRHNAATPETPSPARAWESKTRIFREA